MGEWPTLHTWADYQVKLLSKARVELGTLVNIHNLKGSVTLFGQYGALLTFGININDKMASHFTEKTRHFIQVLRDGTSVWEGFTVKTQRRYGPMNQGLAEFIEVTCMPLSQIVGWRHGQPVTGTTLESTGRTADDGFKWLLERTHGATAPNSPTNATNRTVTGFTFEADTTERAGNVTIKATGKQMYDLLLRMGARYEVDWWVEFDASWNTEFKTKYPRRGLDKTEGNGARTEVIFNDSADTARSVDYGHDASDTITAAMNKPMTMDVEDTTLHADWLYIETIIDTEDTEELEAELARRGVATFYKSDFMEKPDLVWDPSGGATGPHFGIGDSITYVNKRLGYGPHDADIAVITFEILADGNEKLTLTFGDPVPDVWDKQKNKRRSQAADAYTFLSYWRRAAATNTIYPAYSASGSPDHVAATWGGDIRTYSDDRSTKTFEADGATGNLWLATAGTTTFGGVAYTWPAADGAGALTSNGAGGLSWAAAVSAVWQRVGTTVSPINAGDDVALYSAGDLLIYDGAPGNLKVWIDGANGYGRFGWGGGTPSIYFGDNNTRIRRDASLLEILTDKSYITLAPGGGTEVICGQGVLYPATENVTQLGWLGQRRWSNVVSVLGNFSSTVTTGALLPHTTNTLDIGVTGTRYRDLWLTRNADIDGTLNVQGQGTFQANVDFGAGIDVTGNITVTGTVDTVDIAAFKTAYDAHTQDLSGETTGWHTDGAADYGAGKNSVRQVGGTNVYMTADGHLSTTSAGNTELLVGSAGHHHNLSGNTGGVTTNLATGQADAP